ncbi:MAG: glycosyltransferase family 2 protein [Geobacteraceae bacterium]|nr:glycosyltransferase family 2 protein [Geobacteraceae bacterium]
MNTAPIILFVYNRLWHTRQVLVALQNNELAVESNLFIYSDGAKSHESIESVREVREYCRAVTGFNSVTIIERDKNLGLAQSIISGISDVLRDYERVIILEDDLVTSPYFLRFMNDALNYYENEDRVISVHGYMYPVHGELPETFFIRDTGCWGWATWRRGWRLFNPDGEWLLKEIYRRRISYVFDMDGSFGFTKMLNQHVLGLIDTWDIRWQASAFLEQKLTLFPGISLVNNIGHDNSGVHSTGTNVFDVKLADQPVKVTFIPVEENLTVRKQLRDYFFSLHKLRFVRMAHRVIAALRSIVRL